MSGSRRLRSRFTELLGLDHPIALAPMSGAVDSALAAAVCNAGGFGILPFSWSDPAAITAELTAMAALTDKPFAVNLCLENPQEERLERCLAYNPGAVHFFWGDAAPYVKTVHEAGALVIQTVSDSDGARRAVDVGADILIAQGWEAGGHIRGDVATMPLIPAVVDAAGGVPVLAAGGIADGRGLAAAICLGASGVVMGTRFLGTRETTAHPEYIARLLHADESDTLYATDLYNVGWSNAPHRVLRNDLAARWLSDGKPANARRAHAGETLAYAGEAAIQAYQSVTPNKQMTGQIEALPMWAGQSVGMLRGISAVSDIIDEAVAEAQALLGLSVTP